MRWRDLSIASYRPDESPRSSPRNYVAARNRHLHVSSIPHRGPTLRDQTCIAHTRQATSPEDGHQERHLFQISLRASSGASIHLFRIIPERTH